jgi:hypothetical protein
LELSVLRVSQALRESKGLKEILVSRVSQDLKVWSALRVSRELRASKVKLGLLVLLGCVVLLGLGSKGRLACKVLRGLLVCKVSQVQWVRLVLRVFKDRLVPRGLLVQKALLDPKVLEVRLGFKGPLVNRV